MVRTGSPHKRAGLGSHGTLNFLSTPCHLSEIDYIVPTHWAPISFDGPDIHSPAFAALVPRKFLPFRNHPLTLLAQLVESLNEREARSCAPLTPIYPPPCPLSHKGRGPHYSSLTMVEPDVK